MTTILTLWPIASNAAASLFGWLNLRHSHPTHNPSRQDGEGDSGRGVYQHGEAN